MPDSRPVVTRFAPSPTGFLHIGGARTALFNWLFAKHHGGRMLLRIEDTDRARSTDAAVAAILDGLAWLELQWDGEPVYQHRNLARHAEVARQLLAEGKAYRCYCSPQELEAMRERAKQEGRAVAYDGTWRDRNPSDAPEGVVPVVRFRSPLEGETVIEDRVQGRVVYANTQLDDLIILRSDGTPTYNLSVVVDDHDMGATHVVRGDDHLTNAARQTQIYEALGWQVPEFAHIPLIHGPDGAKLSKRHGALGVEAYRDMGYLPEAMRNYLVRLGWSHGDAEIISLDRMIEWFDLDAVGRSPARFDFDKLNNLNGHYIRETDDARLTDRLVAFWRSQEEYAPLLVALTPERRMRLQSAIGALKARAKTLIELTEGARFLFVQRPLALDEKAAELIDDDARATLSLLHGELQAVETWSHTELERSVRVFAERHDLKLGAVAQPMRAALTGTTRSPGIFEVLEFLGRDEALGRIADQAASPA